MLVLEPIFEREFLPLSYGFRPERSKQDALREVEGSQGKLLLGGRSRLENYFDSIPKGPLLARVAERVSDSDSLQLVQRFLDQDILDGLERWTPMAAPRRVGLSPLLANLCTCIHWISSCHSRLRIVRMQTMR